MIWILAGMGLLAIWIAPVIWLWCIKPGKSIQEGLRDWLDDSTDDG